MRRTACSALPARRRSTAAGPFAVKLNGDLVRQLQALAQERGGDMNALVAELLQKGLAE
jgi:predicted HicB family RNase H-like nuclease